MQAKFGHTAPTPDLLGPQPYILQNDAVEVIREPGRNLLSFSGNLSSAPRSSAQKASISGSLPVALRDSPQSIAKSMMLPHDTTPVRVVDRFSIVPTAVSQPWRIQEADFSAAAIAGAPLPSGNFFAAASRNPLSAMITYVPGGHDAGNTRQLIDFAVDAGTNLGFALGYAGFATPWTFYLTTIGDNIVTSNIIGCESYTAGFSAPSTYHDGYLFANTTSAGPCVYLAAGTILQVTRLAGPFWNASSASTIRIFLDKLEGESFVEVSATLITTGAALTGLTGRAYSDLTQYASIVVGFEGHYRLRCAWWNNSAVAVAVQPVGLEVRAYCYNAFYSISAMPGIRAHSAIVRRLRVCGMAIMVSPYSAAMFRGGRCAGRQLEDQIYWVDSAKLVDQIISMPNAGDRSFSNGLYGFSKPSCVECLQMQPVFHYPINASTLDNAGGSFWSYNSTLGHIPNSLHNPVYPPGGWLVIAVEAALGELGSTVAYPSGRCHVSNFFSIEFETTDTWMSTAVPSTTTEEFDRGLAVVRSAQQWHENKMHISDILRFVSGAANVGLKIAPTLAVALRMFPATAAVGNALAIASTAANAAREAVNVARSEKKQGKKKKKGN